MKELKCSGKIFNQKVFKWALTYKEYCGCNHKNIYVHRQSSRLL